MEFDNNKPIYLQIIDSFCNTILSGERQAEDRIPSVREYGASIGVNPNTVARSYEKLTDMGIIYNKRGIGFFITNEAPQIIRNESRRQFIEEELPKIKEKISLLGFTAKEIGSLLNN